MLDLVPNANVCSNQATIQVIGRIARLPQQFTSMVTPALTSIERRFVAAGGGNFWQPVPFVSYDVRDGYLIFPAAQLRIVVETLTAAGVAVEVDHPDAYEFGFDAVVEPSGPAGNVTDCLRQLQCNLYGRVAVNKVGEKLEVIARAYDMFPAALILIVVHSVREGRQLARELEQRLRAPVGFARTRNWGAEERILVVTLAAFEVTAESVYTVVFFIDVLPMCRKRGDWFARLLYRDRLFGFQDGRWCPKGTDALHLEAFSGPVLYRFPESQNPAAHVSVLWAKVAKSTSRSKLGTAIERKRQLYFGNKTRNAAICRLASELRAGNGEILKEFGLRSLPLTNTTPPNVVILVESLEHGRLLRSRMADWQLFEVSHFERESPAQVVLGGAAIMTELFAAQLGVLPGNILIIASSSSTMPVPRGFEACAWGVQREVIVIDFADAFDAAACQSARDRDAAYRRRGYTVLPEV